MDCYARGDIGPQFATTYRLPTRDPEPFAIGYAFEGKPHDYLPDVVGTLTNGKLFIAEAGGSGGPRMSTSISSIGSSWPLIASAFPTPQALAISGWLEGATAASWHTGRCVVRYEFQDFPIWITVGDSQARNQQGRVQLSCRGFFVEAAAITFFPKEGDSYGNMHTDSSPTSLALERQRGPVQ